MRNEELFNSSFLTPHLASRFVEQSIIEQCHGSHGLHDGDRTGNDAGIVTATGFEDCLLALFVHRRLFHKEGGNRLERHPEVDVLSIGNTALNAS